MRPPCAVLKLERKTVHTSNNVASTLLLLLLLLLAMNFIRMALLLQDHFTMSVTRNSAKAVDRHGTTA